VIEKCGSCPAALTTPVREPSVKAGRCRPDSDKAVPQDVLAKKSRVLAALGGVRIEPTISSLDRVHCTGVPLAEIVSFATISARPEGE
jgi:hypothetical protein